MKNRLCVYGNPYPRFDTDFKKVDAAAEYGMVGVECIKNAQSPNKPNIEEAKRLKAYAEEKNIVFPCYSVFVDFSKDDFREMIERVKDYAHTAKALGSPYLHHTIITEAYDPDKVLPFRAEYYRRGIEAVREIYDYAESVGIKTIYEDQGYIFNGVEGFGNFLADVNRDVGVVADFGNVYETCDSITEFIEAFGDKICHAHLKDMLISDDACDGKRMKSLNGKYVVETDIGSGSVDIKGGLESLRKIGYDGYFSIEYCAYDDNSSKYEDGLKYIRKLF